MKTRRRTKSKTEGATTVTVRVDKALKAAWEKAAGALAQAQREGMGAFDRKYETVGEILDHEPPLYLAGGMSTARAFIARYLPGEDERSVRRAVRVARYASPVEEQKYGVANIDAAIDFIEAKTGAPARGRVPVDFEKLRIPTAEGSVRFADATLHQLRDATRALRRGKKRVARDPVVVEVEKRLPPAAKSVVVSFANGHITLSRIPARVFSEVMRALAKARVPTERR